MPAASRPAPAPSFARGPHILKSLLYSGFIEKILYDADFSEFQGLAPPAPATRRQASVKRMEEDEEEVVAAVKEEEEEEMVEEEEKEE